MMLNNIRYLSLNPSTGKTVELTTQPDAKRIPLAGETVHIKRKHSLTDNTVVSTKDYYVYLIYHVDSQLASEPGPEMVLITIYVRKLSGEEFKAFLHRKQEELFEENIGLRWN